MIFFKVDANPTIGMGHLKRCLMIAQALKEKAHSIRFILTNSPAEIIRQVAGEFEVMDGATPSNWLESIKSTEGSKLLIIDSDDTSLAEIDLQREVRTAGVRLMYITIDSKPHYEADIVFNQNILSLSQKYSVASHTKLLLGPSYFIFQEAFRKDSIPYRDRSVYALLIAFGGSDHHNLTTQALTVLRDTSTDRLEHIHVVCGQMNAHLNEIEELVKSFSTDQISLHVNTPYMPEIMEECDAALISFGLTYWELVMLGIPSLVIASSSREKYLFDALKKSNYFWPVGSYDQTNLKPQMEKSISKLLSGDRKHFRQLPALQEQIDPRGLYNLVAEIDKMMA